MKNDFIRILPFSVLLMSLTSLLNYYIFEKFTYQEIYNKAMREAYIDASIKSVSSVLPMRIDENTDWKGIEKNSDGLIYDYTIRTKNTLTEKKYILFNVTSKIKNDAIKNITNREFKTLKINLLYVYRDESGEEVGKIMIPYHELQ